MLRHPDRWRVLALAAVLAAPVAAAPARQAPDGSAPAGQPASSGPFGLKGFGGKEPINITSDNLEYDYKNQVVVYRGGVEVIQGQTKLRSDNLTVTLTSEPTAGGTAPATKSDPKTDPAAAASEPAPKSAAATDDSARVREIVAAGSVRIDQGARWAVGGRAVFDQATRTVILTENPVLHDGPNEVAGERVIVFLDEDRSVVEGGRRRVKAVLYPKSQEAKTENGKTEAGKTGAAKGAGRKGETGTTQPPTATPTAQEAAGR